MNQKYYDMSLHRFVMLIIGFIISGTLTFFLITKIPSPDSLLLAFIIIVLMWLIPLILFIYSDEIYIWFSKKTIFLFLIIGVILVSGCSTEKVECEIDGDCAGNSPQKCVNNKCLHVQCLNDNHCNPFTFGSWRECINNECVIYIEDCQKIAIKDYNMKNPSCRYINNCFCEDYIIDFPEKRIVKDNSIQIISEKGHYENYVIFEIKKR